MVVGLMMMASAVVVSVVVLGPPLGRGLAVVVGLFMVVRLTFRREPAVVGEVAVAAGSPGGVGLTVVVRPTVQSPATLAVFIIKQVLGIGMAGEDSVAGSRRGEGCGVAGSATTGGVVVAVAGRMAGEGTVREVLELAAVVVRPTTVMGHIRVIGRPLVAGLVMAMGRTGSGPAVRR